jgi:outer membrane protein assembly factor BamB
MRLLAPNEAANPVQAGEQVVVVSHSKVVAYAIRTGSTAWETSLPGEVCAGSKSVNDSGVMVLLLGSGGSCVDALALDTTNGHTLWKVPIPRASRAFGHEVSVGPDTAVVTGECAGFTRLRLVDGSVAGGVTGVNVVRRCATATSDGTTVVMSSRGRLSVFDAGSGKRLGSWAARGLSRVGDILTRDPMVVTARYTFGARLVDLSGSRPRVFGRDKGWFGGEVPASYRLGDTLWVRYDGLDKLVGYHLTTRHESSKATIGFDSALVGTLRGQLVVAMPGNSLSMLDPSASPQPVLAGALPDSPGQNLPLVASEVIGSSLVRVWQGRVESIRLPSR